MVGTKVTLRVRMSAGEAHYAGELVKRQDRGRGHSDGLRGGEGRFMTAVHPTAVVHPRAILGTDVVCWIGRASCRERV